jgi:hypothetical protein
MSRLPNSNVIAVAASPPFISSPHCSDLKLIQQSICLESTAMFRITGDPSVVMPVAVVIVVPIPLASLDYTGGSGESDQGKHEAAAHNTPRGYRW